MSTKQPKKLRPGDSRPIRPVIQQENTGCGIACAAALAGLSYAQAKRIAAGLGITAADPKLWSDTKPIRKLLARLNIKTAARTTPFKSWQTLPDCALLAIKWHRENGTPFWHWTVFVREGENQYVLDPAKALKQHRRTDFGRMRPKWHIAVRR